jgi:hypothetical protein
MKTWIFCAETGHAKVFRTSEDHGLQFCSEVVTDPGERRKFSRYLADEIEIACGGGTDCRFLICGDPALVNSVCQCLSDGVRKLIIGIVPKNVTRESFESLRDRTSKLIEKWEYKHGHRVAA